MMIHSSNERAQDPKHSFNLTRVGKLKLLVNIPVVVDWPPGIDLFVNCSSIGVKNCFSSHKFIQKLPCMFSGRMGMGKNLVGEFSTSNLFSKKQCPSFLPTKVCFI